MRKVFFSLAMFISVTSFGQMDILSDWNKSVISNWQGGFIRVGSYQVKGSPYLLGQSFPGTLVYKSGKVVTDRKILYDLHNQRAGIDTNNEIFEATDPLEQFTIILPAQFDGRQLLFKNANAFSDKPPVAYLNVLEEGEKVILFKAFKSTLVPDPINAMAKDLRLFDQSTEYYLYSRATKELTKVKAKEKDFIKVLNDEQNIKIFNKDNEIDFTKEADLIKLVHFYNRNFQAEAIK